MWKFQIPDWIPPSVNPSVGRHWSKIHKDKDATAMILGMYALLGKVPLTSYQYRPVRLLTLSVFGWGNGETIPDPDNLQKIFLDGATRCRLIVDDHRDWCVMQRPFLERADVTRTVVTVEDLELKPAVEPADDPHTRRMLSAMLGRLKRRQLRRGQ